MSDRRKKQPYRPGKEPVPGHLTKQLGVPTPYRRQHTPKGYDQGFDIQPLAAGFERGGGVVRSRERAMLTPPDLQRQMLEDFLQKKREAGEEMPQTVRIALTPSDKVIAHNPYIVHDYITTHKEVEAKTIKVSNYEGAISAGDIHRLPLQDHEFRRRHFYAWIQDNCPLAVQKALMQVCEQCNPEVMARAHGREPEEAITKAGIGRYWTRENKSDRDAVNNADGVLALAASVLAELHMEYSTEIDRARRLAKIAFDHRKKIHYT